MGPGSTSPEPPRDVGQGWNPWPKGVLRSWLCLHVPAERGGSTPGGAPSSLFSTHPRKAACNSGNSHCMWVWPNVWNSPEENTKRWARDQVCKPALCWKARLASSLRPIYNRPECGIGCRQKGHRLEVGTSRGANTPSFPWSWTILAENRHLGEKPQKEVRKAHESAANRGGLSTVPLLEKLVHLRVAG